MWSASEASPSEMSIMEEGTTSSFGQLFYDVDAGFWFQLPLKQESRNRSESGCAPGAS